MRKVRDLKLLPIEYHHLRVFPQTCYEREGSMAFIELVKKNDLAGVKAILQSGKHEFR